jgi:hypothetical protein
MLVLTMEQAEKLPRIRFPDENRISFFMDFAFWCGLPSDRDFFVVGPAPGGLGLEFVARGYGIKGDYGNGSVFAQLAYVFN